MEGSNYSPEDAPPVATNNSNDDSNRSTACAQDPAVSEELHKINSELVLDLAKLRAQVRAGEAQLAEERRARTSAGEEYERQIALQREAIQQLTSAAEFHKVKLEEEQNRAKRFRAQLGAVHDIQEELEFLRRSSHPVIPTDFAAEDAEQGLEADEDFEGVDVRGSRPSVVVDLRKASLAPSIARTASLPRSSVVSIATTDSGTSDNGDGLCQSELALSSSDDEVEPEKNWSGKAAAVKDRKEKRRLLHGELTELCKDEVTVIRNANKVRELHAKLLALDEQDTGFLGQYLHHLKSKLKECESPAGSSQKAGVSRHVAERLATVIARNQRRLLRKCNRVRVRKMELKAGMQAAKTQISQTVEKLERESSLSVEDRSRCATLKRTVHEYNRERVLSATLNMTLLGDQIAHWVSEADVAGGNTVKGRVANAEAARLRAVLVSRKNDLEGLNTEIAEEQRKKAAASPIPEDAEDEELSEDEEDDDDDVPDTPSSVVVREPLVAEDPREAAPENCDATVQVDLLLASHVEQLDRVTMELEAGQAREEELVSTISELRVVNHELATAHNALASTSEADDTAHKLSLEVDRVRCDLDIVVQENARLHREVFFCTAISLKQARVIRGLDCSNFHVNDLYETFQLQRNSGTVSSTVAPYQWINDEVNRLNSLSNTSPRSSSSRAQSPAEGKAKSPAKPYGKWFGISRHALI